MARNCCSLFNFSRSPFIQRQIPLLFKINYSQNALKRLKLMDVNLPTTRVSTLANGMRVVSENWNTPTSTVGIFVNTGSRYETDSTNGVAHFLEHMAFKGTSRRMQQDIELEVENRGAKLNAYTSREITCYYAKCFTNDIPWAVDLISDILLHGLLDKNLLERERGVILREMQEVATNYQEVVFDLLHAGAYAGHSLGWTILGPEENVNNLQRHDLQDFLARNYRGPELALVGVGGIDHDKLHAVAEQHFSLLSPKPAERNIPSFSQLARQECSGFFQPGEASRFVESQIPQAHFAIALEGPGWCHADTLVLMLASHICGHWQRTSGLPSTQISRNLPVKCYQEGVVHSYQSFFTCYRETSLWGIYVVAEGVPGLRQVITHIQEEWRGLTDTVTDGEIERAKNQFCTSLLLQLDGTTPNCEEIGRQLFAYNRRIPVVEMLERIMSITPECLRQTCRKYIIGRKPTIASVGPVQDIPQYSEILRGMK